MTASNSIMEALSRIEHKLDLLLKNAEITAEISVAVGSPVHKCPLCDEYVKYNVEMNPSAIIRKCGCSTGKIAPIDLSIFAPNTKIKENSNGTNDEEIPSTTTDSNRRRLKR